MKRSRSTSPALSTPQSRPDRSDGPAVVKKTRLPTLHTTKQKTALESFLMKAGQSSKTVPTSSGSASTSVTTNDASPTPVSDGPNPTTPEIITLDDIDDIAPRSGEITSLPPPLPTTAKIPAEAEADGASSSHSPHSEQKTWTCSRCQKQIKEADTDLALDIETRAEMFVIAKQEHADYHFALDLQNGVSSSSSTSAPGAAQRKPGVFPPKKKKKPEGIKAFFAPKPK